MVSHHTRKPGKEGISDWAQEGIGSQGIVAAADCVMSLQRKRGEDTANLLITGRAVEDCRIPMKFDRGYWVKNYHEGD